MIQSHTAGMREDARFERQMLRAVEEFSKGFGYGDLVYIFSLGTLGYLGKSPSVNLHKNLYSSGKKPFGD